MTRPTITVPVEPDATLAYNSASDQEKRKIEALLGFWLKELLADQSQTLKEVVEEIGQKARERGLTAETLESLLKGA
jgi:hypothetical protein